MNVLCREGYSGFGFVLSFEDAHVSSLGERCVLVPTDMYYLNVFALKYLREIWRPMNSESLQRKHI